MKRFIITSAIFGFILTTIITALYCLIPPNRNSYIYEINHKLRLVDSMPSSRIIFIGGSNVAFGVDSKAISDSLGITAINTGLHASIGLKYQIESVAEKLKKDDIVIIMPEYQQFYKDQFYGESYILSSMFKYRGCRDLHLMNFRQIENVICGMTKTAFDDIWYAHRVDTMYSSLNFNSFGDEIHHRHINFNKKIKLEPVNGDLNSNAINSTAELIRKLKGRGHIVLFFPPLTVERYHKMNRQRIEALTSALADAGIPFDIETGSHALPDSCSFDTHYHINDAGVRLITPQLANRIRAVIKTKTSSYH